MSVPGTLRNVLSSAGRYGLAHFLTYGLPFFLLPLWTRYLTPAQWGEIALAETVGLLVAVVILLGLPAALTRLWFGASEDERPRLAGSIATSALVAVAIGTALTLAIGPSVMGLVAPGFSVSFYPLIGLGIAAAVAREFNRVRLSAYQVVDASGAYASFSMVGALLAAALSVLLVVALDLGGVGLLSGRAAGQGAMLVVGLVLLVPFFRAGVSSTHVRSALWFGLPLVPHQIVAYLLVGADRFVLELYEPLAVVGTYSVAYSLANAVSILAAALVTAWGPRFYEAGSNAGDLDEIALIGHKMLMGLALAAMVGIVACEPVVALILGPGFVSSGALIPIIAIGTLLHSWFMFFQLGVYQAKRTAMMVLFTGSAAIANLALNFALVPSMGADGAAWATAGAYGLEAALVYVFAQRVFPVPYVTWRLVLQALLCCGVGVLLVVTRGVGARWLIVVPVALVAAAMVYRLTPKSA